ncbi:MAG: YARHG domain-containing protein, partial [Candidatus Hydrogenedentes bacterium]|nr:YARHG domain-containing protein [Candidatus Hydrogenedentota bacterium]
MKTICAITVFVLWAGVCLPAGANDSATVGVGGSVMLMRDHPTVVMESAKINVHLASERVECNYVLHNTGKETDVLVGFPERSWGGGAGSKGFKDFRSYVDGQEVPVEPRPALTNLGGGFERFWVKEVHFAGGQTRAVRNTYFGGRGTGGAGDEWFVYDVSTAASWKGRIGDILVSVDLTGIGPDFQADGIYPSGYERSKDEIVWHWKDIEPVENIYIAFCRWYRDIWVDGANDFREHGTITLWVDGTDDWIKQGVIPGTPSMATGVLTADLFRIAGWLGLDGPSEPAGDKPAALTGRGKSITFVPGQAVASVDGHEVALGATVHRTNDNRTLEAPVIPVAEAFGFSARFDPLTRRTYLYSPEALGAAKTPEWLTRGLTEEDLRDKSSEELRLMRNEVYARRGREFQDKDLRHHFYCQSWYQPKPNYT